MGLCLSPPTPSEILETLGSLSHLLALRRLWNAVMLGNQAVLVPAIFCFRFGVETLRASAAPRASAAMSVNSVNLSCPGYVRAPRQIELEGISNAECV